MTKQEKNFLKIIKGKKVTYSFDEVRIFLEHYGFEMKNSGSSHFIFRRAGFPHITLVNHGNQVKRVYVKNMVKILKHYSILS